MNHRGGHSTHWAGSFFFFFFLEGGDPIDRQNLATSGRESIEIPDIGRLVLPIAEINLQQLAEDLVCNSNSGGEGSWTMVGLSVR